MISSPMAMAKSRFFVQVYSNAQIKFCTPLKES